MKTFVSFAKTRTRPTATKPIRAGTRKISRHFVASSPIRISRRVGIRTTPKIPKLLRKL